MFFKNSELPELFVSWTLGTPPMYTSLWFEVDRDKNYQFSDALVNCRDRLAESDNELELQIASRISEVLYDCIVTATEGEGTTDYLAVMIDGTVLYISANCGRWRISCAEHDREKYHLINALSKYFEKALT